MEYPYISTRVYDCTSCPTPCDDKSKGAYIFERDVALSEYFEERIMAYIISKGVYTALKTQSAGYPDVEVYCENRLHAFVEVKVQQRTFMKVEHFLPNAHLCPSETIGLNSSDLERYCTLTDTLHKPVYVVWVLLNRPCILNTAPYKVFAQKVEVLRDIYNRYKIKRRFTRQSGEGDIVDGKHRGVVVNYHFSLNELKEWERVLE